MSRQLGSQRIELRQAVKVDPSMVLRSKVLAMTSHELQQAIDTELADNPALERIETETEPITEDQVLKAVAPHELKFSNEDSEQMRCMSPDDPKVEWTELAPTSNTMLDHVRAQLAGRVAPEHAALANYMADSLTERGYLGSSLEEIALETNQSLEAVECVLQKLQNCEPAGVGARTVVECLLLQLRHPESFEEKLARAILEHHLDELVARRTQKISRRYKVLPNVVEAAFDVITALNPNPGEGFSNATTSMIVSQSAAVWPDLVLRRTDFGWEIEPKGGDPTLYRVNEAYQRRMAALAAGRRIDPEEAAHLAEYAQRAEQFIQVLKDRRRTMRQIGMYLVERQAGFVSTGQCEFLTTLTRYQLAQDLGVHESTISRATMGKFVQIGNGDVVPFEIFFKPALRVQKMIEDILANENPNAPLSDEAIAKLLEKKGVFVARRTVNKYRDRTRLLNSRTRRSA